MGKTTYQLVQDFSHQQYHTCINKRQTVIYEALGALPGPQPPDHSCWIAGLCPPGHSTGKAIASILG